MQSDNAIEVKNISKKFKVYLDKGGTLKEKILFTSRRKYEERIVLNDISFEVKKGEAIGLIGQNGCGKSTTLKLLTRIMYPDSGTIEMKGRVSSLIELGAGFHPDMSGRQNIYTNASIFGLTRKEIDRRFDDIVAFSELEEFIDNPVRTYSSGMYMRLAFSVAINVDAEILLIDEILAVGDANFQAKCFNKLREIKAQGTTIVIVSHSLGQIEQICERSIWIQAGKINAIGTPREIHPQYMDFMGQKRISANEQDVVPITENHSREDEKNANETQFAQRWGNGCARIISIQLKDNNGKEKNVFMTGGDINLLFSYSIKSEIKDVVFGIGIFRSDGFQCYGTNTKIEHFKEFNLFHNGTVELLLKNVQLLPGEYWIDIAIESEMGIPVDYYTNACKFAMYSDIADVGLSRITHEWSI